MLISLDWIRDYVDLPANLDPRDLAERLTRTTAEVEGVHQIAVGARGLVAARVERVEKLAGTRNLSLAILNLGGGKTVETVTAAPAIHVGSNLVYAPSGASVASLGKIAGTEIAGRPSAGMIPPGDSLGIAMAVQEAVFLPPSLSPGDALTPGLFDDWVIEIDNKSLTHRPDLWGHYGIAREIAAICGVALKPMPLAALDELADGSLDLFPISIADPQACRRYTGLVVTGVPTQPAPLWMQLRLGRVGMRPISGLVDLTNYVMADVGQPMHAFDAAKATSIEVNWAHDGDLFRTLDGVERSLTGSDLMIQCGGKSIALAGVMGGFDTEVSESTESLLLESANFDPATIRRTATRLGLRTDASARFEKSLDPAHTVLSIQRFVDLARPMYPELRLARRLSDCYPSPSGKLSVRVDPRHVARTIGRTLTHEEAFDLLEPLGFAVTPSGTHWDVSVPSFRATNDISIEADVIEELARYVGYGSIAPVMPQVTVRRFAIHALHELERRSLEHLTTAHRFHEIHAYTWYDAPWLAQLGFDPGTCVALKNPAAEGLHQFRQTLMPGMLAAVVRNRFHFSAFSLIELGSVFERGDGHDREFRHVGLVCAKRGKRSEAELYDGLKGAIETWAWHRFSTHASFSRVEPDGGRPWEHPRRTAGVVVQDTVVGRVSVVDLSLRRAMDEHLAAWSIVWAELRLSGLEELPARAEPLGRIPDHPLVEMDFSLLVPAADSYAEVVGRVNAFEHPLLTRVRYVGSYEGGAIGGDQRSLTFRVVVGDPLRTLTDTDTRAFRAEFEEHLKHFGYTMRA